MAPGSPCDVSSDGYSMPRYLIYSLEFATWGVPAKSLLLVCCALSLIWLLSGESQVRKVVSVLDSLPVVTKFTNTRSPCPKVMHQFSWNHEFTDLNIFDIFQRTAIIVFIAAETVSSRPVGNRSLWPLSPFGTTVTSLP